MIPYLDSCQSLIDDYDGFIVDLWGVVHDGSALYDGIKESLQAIKAQNKPLIFLSNAPRRASRSKANLTRLGITNDLYTDIITSGETCIAHIESTLSQQQAYFMGPDYERDMVHGTTIQLNTDLSQADYIVCIGHEYDNQPIAELRPILEDALHYKLPLLCANPDRLIITRDGWVCSCAGEIADAYEGMGGKVHYFGKPHATVYHNALQTLNLPEGRILAIGDNPDTDIAGAYQQNIDSLLLTQGVLSHDVVRLSKDEIIKMVAKQDTTPTYIAESFSL